MSTTDRLKKVFKVILVVLGALFFLFGVFGAFHELSFEKVDTMGLVLVVFWGGLGMLFIFLGLRKPRKRLPVSPPDIQEEPIKVKNMQEQLPLISKIEPEKPEEKYPAKKSTDFVHPSWQRKFLIITAGIELLFILIIMVVSIIVGIAGFEAGEMGTMIGFFMVPVILLFSALIAIKIAVLWGIVKYKRWAAWLNFALMINLTFIFLFTVFPLIIYTVFSGWCSYYIAKHNISQ